MSWILGLLCPDCGISMGCPWGWRGLGLCRVMLRSPRDSGTLSEGCCNDHPFSCPIFLLLWQHLDVPTLRFVNPQFHVDSTAWCAWPLLWEQAHTLQKVCARGYTAKISLCGGVGIQSSQERVSQRPVFHGEQWDAGAEGRSSTSSSCFLSAGLLPHLERLETPKLFGKAPV